MAEADLHNLAPAIGEVNGVRSNMRFGMVNTPVHEYGACEVLVSFEERTFQPPPHRRGDIARTYWYMRDTFGIEISRQHKASLIYRRTKNLRAVPLILGHTKQESTVRYLGIEVEDALEMAEQKVV